MNEQMALINVLVAVIAAALTAGGVLWGVIRSILSRIDDGDASIWKHVRRVEAAKADKAELDRLHTDALINSQKLDNMREGLNTRMDQILLALTQQRSADRGSPNN